MENKETTREQLLKQLFASHPEVDKIYMTSDDQAFTKDHHAHAHAPSLADKEVKEYDRPAPEVKEAKVKSLVVPEETAPKADDPKAEETKVDEPKAEETKADEPKAEEATDPEVKAEADPLAALRAEYLRLYGKPASHFMKAPGLQKAIDQRKLKAD